MHNSPSRKEADKCNCIASRRDINTLLSAVREPRMTSWAGWHPGELGGCEGGARRLQAPQPPACFDVVYVNNTYGLRLASQHFLCIFIVGANSTVARSVQMFTSRVAQKLTHLSTHVCMYQWILKHCWTALPWSYDSLLIKRQRVCFIRLSATTVLRRIVKPNTAKTDVLSQCMTW